MTTIAVPGDIPSEVSTLEKLTLHNIMALHALYGNLTFPLSSDLRQQPKVDVAIGRAFDGKVYGQCTVFFELDETIAISGNPQNKKPWMAALDLGTNTYPAAYRQNSPS